MLDDDSRRWARARDDYRAGMTGAEVCARHGIGRTAFYARAQAERWRRADLPSNAPLVEEDDFDPAQPRQAASALAEQAHRRMAHAVGQGRLREALGWSRLGRELRDLAVLEENTGWRKLRTDQREAEAQAAESVRRSPEPVSPQALEDAEGTNDHADSPDSFGESAPCPPDEDAALSTLPPPVLAACREILQREADPDVAWAELLPLLEGARPDLDWRGERAEDEDEDEIEEPP